MSATSGPGGATSDRRRSRKPGVIVLLSGLGILAAAAALMAVRVGPGLIETFAGLDATTPHTAIREFDRGTYVVFELTSRGGSRGGVLTGTRPTPQLRPTDVRVVDATGRAVEVYSVPHNQTVDIDDQHYVGVVEFDVPSAGVYTVSVDSPPGVTFFIAPSLGSTFGRAVPGVVIGGIGLVAFLIGLVMLVAASARQPVAITSGLPPAGWYPDPEHPGVLRWWDGQRWGPRSG